MGDTTRRITILVIIGALAGVMCNAIRPAPLPWVHEGFLAISLQELLIRSKSPKTVIADARSPELFEQAHFPGAINIPESQKENYVGVIRERIPVDSFIIIYCGGDTCDQSERVAQFLVEIGFERKQVRIFEPGWPLLKKEAVQGTENGKPWTRPVRRVKSAADAWLDFFTAAIDVLFLLFILAMLLVAIVLRGRSSFSGRAAHIICVCTAFVLALLFIWSGVLKIASPAGFATDIRGYAILPLVLVNAFAILLPWWEITWGLALFFKRWRAAAACLIGALGCVLAIAVGSAIVRGLDIACGCAGRASMKVGLPLLAVDLSIIIGASLVILCDVWLARGEKENSTGGADKGSTPGGGVGLEPGSVNSG